jgi:hypothetical protein
VRSGSGEANGSVSRVLPAAGLTKRRRSLDAGDAGGIRLVSVTARRVGGCDSTAPGAVVEGGGSKCEKVSLV